MTSALNSHFGLALQTAKGTPNSTDADFKYFYFSEGVGSSPTPVVIPLEQEIGSGSLTREVEKVGISTGGAMNFVPRPDSLGWFLLGALGDVSTATSATGNTHTFKFGADEFDCPYFTIRKRMGALGTGGEVFADTRVGGFSLNFNAADYLRAQMQLVGVAAPARVADISAWNYASQMDVTPPFLTTTGLFQLPTGTGLKVLRGSVNMATQMPLDEQWIVGSYTPDDAEIVSRAYTVQAIVKADATLYNKMMYDAAAGTDWTTSVYREANLTITFESSQFITGTVPYSLQVKFNMEAAAGNPNVTWTVEPIALRGNRQVLMQVTGTVLADKASYADGPFSVVLINNTAAYE